MERFKDYLQKVFVPRFTSDGQFPKERGIYFVDNLTVKVAYYEVGLGFVANIYSKDKVDVRWWLEEVTLPSEDEINKIKNASHRAGAIWYRDFVLDVTPKEID